MIPLGPEFNAARTEEILRKMQEDKEAEARKEFRAKVKRWLKNFGSFVAGVAVFIYVGFVVKYGWNILVVPLGFPPITLSSAIGLILLVNLFRTVGERSKRDFIEIILIKFFAAGVAHLCFFLVST